MDSNLRLAWTQIVTGEDYEQHMAAVGQAQASAALTAELIQAAKLPDGSRILIAGAGTGQVFDFLDASVFRPFRLRGTDLNPAFLARLRERLLRNDLNALLIADDLEHTALVESPELLLAVLLLEHIDWHKGVEAIAAIRPASCGIIIQENPPGMTTAVTPGRQIPASMAAAVKIAHPKLVSQPELQHAFAIQNYSCALSRSKEVADGKRLIAMLFVAQHRSR